MDTAPHRFELGGGFSLWRSFLLRGAGFPAAELLRLASSEVARAVDVLDRGGADAQAEARRSFDAEQLRVGEIVRSIAEAPRFREAVTWQNAAAVHTALDPILRAQRGTHNARTRMHWRLVASYLQRYCVKADSIGFFGPASWGSIVDGDEPIRVRPGPELIADRRVHFEGWAIDALARRLADAEGMRPYLPPRRRATVRCEAGTCWFEDGCTEALTADAERLVALCDGERSVHELARALDLTEQHVLALLGDLAEREIVTWTLEVPVNLQDPERALRRALEALPRSVGEPALAALSELEAARDQVRSAAGSAPAVEAALAAASATFERVTGSAATRRAGQTYAGRTVLYEDCTRDVELTLGTAAIDRMRAPLALVLASARWYLHTVGERFRALFRETYRRLRGAAPEIGYAGFLRALEPQFSGAASVVGGPSSLVHDVLAEVAARWAKLLAIAPGAREQRFSAVDLAPGVAAAFPASECAAPHMRYHCPDLIIAAADADAIARGELSWVLSELHTGWHTFATPWGLGYSSDPDAVIRARAADLGWFEIVPVFAPDRYIRAFPTTFSDADVHFELADGKSAQVRRQVLAAADLVVLEQDGEIVVRNRPDGRCFDALDFHVFFVNRAASSQFSIVPPLAHTPRIRIDDLVVARESWKFERAEVPFLVTPPKDAFGRFVAVRRWARACGLPRFVFVRVPEEKKPVYVDFESTIFVDAFVHMTRDASRLTVSEMLAGHSELWLPDREDRRYVCELRMAVLDTSPIRSSAARGSPAAARTQLA
jgi:lantibiotic biosynthesis dehydratase-like protein